MSYRLKWFFFFNFLDNVWFFLFSAISVKKSWPYVKLSGSQTTPTNMRTWFEWWGRLSPCWRERSRWVLQIPLCNNVYTYLSNNKKIFSGNLKYCIWVYFMHFSSEPHTAGLRGGAAVSAPSGEADHSPIQLHLRAVAALLCSRHTAAFQTGLRCTTAYASTTSLW